MSVSECVLSQDNLREEVSALCPLALLRLLCLLCLLELLPLLICSCKLQIWWVNIIGFASRYVGCKMAIFLFPGRATKCHNTNSALFCSSPAQSGILKSQIAQCGRVLIKSAASF